MLMMTGEEAKRGRGQEGFSTLMVALGFQKLLGVLEGKPICDSSRSVLFVQWTRGSSGRKPKQLELRSSAGELSLEAQIVSFISSSFFSLKRIRKKERKERVVTRGFQDWSGHWGGNSLSKNSLTRLRVEWDGLDLFAMTSSTLIRWSFKGVRGRVTQYAAPVAEMSKSRERKRERPTTLRSGWVVSRFWWGFALRWVGVGYMVALGGLWGCSQWWLGVLVELTEGIEGILLIGIHKRERRSFCRCLQPLCYVPLSVKAP